MYKIFYITLLLLLLVIIVYIYPKRYKYIKKEDDKLYVTVKGHEYDWNKDFYDKFLYNQYPDKKQIVITKISNPDILIVSHFFNKEDYLLHVDKDVPFITWSGESHRVKGFDNKKAKFNLLSQKPLYKNDIWFPFLLSTNYLSKDRLLTIKDKKPIEERKFLVAYIASNCVPIREELFRILNTKYNQYGTHALGRCSNNYEKAEGNWSSLDNTYENYIFGFALENIKKEGYITEKILNVFRSGAIPIFYGDSKSAQKFFNKDSYIDISDFNSLEEAADYIYKLSQDKEELKKKKNINIFKDTRLMNDIDYFISEKRLKL